MDAGRGHSLFVGGAASLSCWLRKWPWIGKEPVDLWAEYAGAVLNCQHGNAMTGVSHAQVVRVLVLVRVLEISLKSFEYEYAYEYEYDLENSGVQHS